MSLTDSVYDFLSKKEADDAESTQFASADVNV